MNDYEASNSSKPILSNYQKKGKFLPNIDNLNKPQDIIDQKINKLESLRNEYTNIRNIVSHVANDAMHHQKMLMLEAKNSWQNNRKL